jgi:hypothetical protein
MTSPGHGICRATQSARAWRRDRMIERLAARSVAYQVAHAAAPDRPVAAEPLTMEIAGSARLLATRHVLIAPEQSLEGRPGRWVV